MTKNAPHTIGCIMRMGAEMFADSPTALLDARILLMHVSALSHAEIIANEHEPAAVGVAEAFQALAVRRASGEPVAHLVGEQEFYGLRFGVTSDVLIPRPETEMIIDAALAVLPAGKPARILDLGTGSGCLLGTLLVERPSARGTGVDLSPAAIGVAQDNLSRLNVAARAILVEGDFSAAPKGPFDIVVSNPPYIEDDALLPKSVRQFEPAIALYAGVDGLNAYRNLAPLLVDRIAPEGYGFLEVGTGQGPAVVELMAAVMPDRPVSFEKDLAGLDRMLVIGPAK
ncbi:MAG: peptide chain release factor N(5)-glutamine methyltransferase [Pseudomonadota bacterium]